MNHESHYIGRDSSKTSSPILQSHCFSEVCGIFKNPINTLDTLYQELNYYHECFLSARKKPSAVPLLTDIQLELELHCCLWASSWNWV